MIGATYSEVTKSTPEKSLIAPKPKTGGRNSSGRLTSKNRGGGNKTRYRMVDFKREKDSVKAKVVRSNTIQTELAESRCSTTLMAKSDISLLLAIWKLERSWKAEKAQIFCPAMPFL